MRQTLKNILHHNQPTTTGTPLGTTTTATTTTTTSTPMVECTTVCTPVAATATTATVTQLPTEHIERPAVIHERIRKEEVEEIQPVIHREHDRTEVHQVVQPMYEGQIDATNVLQKELAAEYRPVLTRGTYVSAPLEKSTVEFEQAERLRVEKAPIIMETERKKIIEEVQPVVYKEIVQPTLIKETLPIYEKIVEAPVVVKEVRPAVYCHPVASTSTFTTQTTGLSSGLGTTGFSSGTSGFNSGTSGFTSGTSGFSSGTSGFSSGTTGLSGNQFMDKNASLATNVAPMNATNIATGQEPLIQENIVIKKTHTEVRRT